jgi:hypothetical protein
MLRKIFGPEVEEVIVRKNFISLVSHHILMG